MDLKIQTVRKSQRGHKFYKHLVRQEGSNFSIHDEGNGDKLLAVREMLTVYRDVYLKYPNLKGEKLLEQIHKYYEGRKNKRWAKIPTPLMLTAGRRDPDDLARAMRNLRR